MSQPEPTPEIKDLQATARRLLLLRIEKAGIVICFGVLFFVHLNPYETIDATWKWQVAGFTELAGAVIGGIGITYIWKSEARLVHYLYTLGMLLGATIHLLGLS